MSLPEIRRPGTTHNDSRYVEIEELFWTNKPLAMHTYNPRDPERFDLVEAPTIDIYLVKRIWGTSWKTRLIPAAHLAHLTIFAFPPFIDAMDAREKDFDRRYKISSRFSEFEFDDNIGTFWTSHASALPIEGTRADPGDMRFSIGGFHSSSRSHKHFDPQHKPRQEYRGIPESSLALSVYEVVKIGEELAILDGVRIQDSDRDIEYEYFRRILTDGGIWMPETRMDMELIAQRIDEMSELTSSTLELTERTIRRAVLTIPNISFEKVSAVLRPGARSIFASICADYGYFA